MSINFYARMRMNYGSTTMEIRRDNKGQRLYSCKRLLKTLSDFNSAIEFSLIKYINTYYYSLVQKYTIQDILNAYRYIRIEHYNSIYFEVLYELVYFFIMNSTIILSTHDHKLINKR